MIAEATNSDPASRSGFPFDKVREILRSELEDAADESVTLHEGWEPVLDSLRVVMVVARLEELFDFDLPPEKIVRKGGYSNVDDGVEDIAGNLRRLWDEHYSSGG